MSLFSTRLFCGVSQMEVPHRHSDHILLGYLYEVKPFWLLHREVTVRSNVGCEGRKASSGSHHSKFQFMTCIERLGHLHCRKMISAYEALQKSWAPNLNFTTRIYFLISTSLVLIPEASSCMSCVHKKPAQSLSSRFRNATRISIYKLALKGGLKIPPSIMNAWVATEDPRLPSRATGQNIEHKLGWWWWWSNRLKLMISYYLMMIYKWRLQKLRCMSKKKGWDNKKQSSKLSLGVMMMMVAGGRDECPMKSVRNSRR